MSTPSGSDVSLDVTKHCDVVIATFYKFAHVPDPEALQGTLIEVLTRAGIKGSILVAPEGLNGTISGSRLGIDTVLKHLRSIPGFDNLTHKESYSDTVPFLRCRVRLKREIVKLGMPLNNDTSDFGMKNNFVPPDEWDTLIKEPDVVVVDVRNDYEVALGTFDGALNPNTKSFGEFPEWWETNRPKFAGKRVAMFCTGGIRCEKAGSYISSICNDKDTKGVYQLHGGILKYLETHEEAWNGECFVFDQRVAVGPGLVPGQYTSCYVCRKPVLMATTDPHYVPGISCSNCYNEVDTVKKERFRERQKQIELARQRGVTHLGSKDVASRGRIKRRQKQKRAAGNCLRKSETSLS